MIDHQTACRQTQSTRSEELRALLGLNVRLSKGYIQINGFFNMPNAFPPKLHPPTVSASNSKARVISGHGWGRGDGSSTRFFGEHF
jgi:hypothetical protein